MNLMLIQVHKTNTTSSRKKEAGNYKIRRGDTAESNNRSEEPRVVGGGVGSGGGGNGYGGSGGGGVEDMESCASLIASKTWVRHSSSKTRMRMN